MKCKLQQPVKDFMLVMTTCLVMLWLVLYFPVYIGYVLIYFEVGLFVLPEGHIFESPEEVYRALGVVWLGLAVLGGFSLGLIYNISKLVKTLILKPKDLKVWFKENIYNCEGN